MLALGLAALLTACGGDSQDDGRAGQVPTGDPGAVHIHGLGVNPRDENLFLATHTGLFRVDARGAEPRRLAGRYQDTMGFAVVGPDAFLGSGHPDGRDELPPFLGLIRSEDAGQTWQPVSLLGEQDFHVLEQSGRRVYGFGTDWATRRERLMVSDDGGRRWRERAVPEALHDLAVDPRDRDRAVAAGAGGLWETVDAGRRWRRLPGPTGLLAWTRRGLFVFGADGGVSAARGELRGRREVGSVEGEPAAVARGLGSDLWVALHDGTVRRSSDDGRSWITWVDPAGGVAGAG